MIGFGSAAAGWRWVGAERLGAVRTFQLSFGIMLLSYVIWCLAPSYLALAAFALALRLRYGGWVALSP